MKSLLLLLLEEEYFDYSGMIRITFDSDILTQAEAIDTIRGIESVTTARSVSGDNGLRETMTLSIKVRSLLSGEKAFLKIRKEALSYSGITKVEIGTKTISKK